ncbi:MAG: glycoside hydrolase family 2 protein [Anaerolineae bacterium]|nr:glycoside hydrolase family 2 protein [Anaerolineae bacterium]
MNTFEITPLDGVWRMLDFDPGCGESQGAAAGTDHDRWYPASVPGDVHTSLLALGRIPEPFYNFNVEDVQWVEKREWWFRRALPHVPAAHAEARDFLVFDGLDLFATVYLNGEKLGEHANMFRPAEFDVTGRLRTDADNLIAVRFDPVRARIAELPKVPGQMPHYDPHARTAVRKTQAQFGWDHTPPCLMVGIWQGVRLERRTTARLVAPHFRVLSADAAMAVVSLDAEVERWGVGSSDDLDVRVRLSLLPEFAHLAHTPHAQTFELRAAVVDGAARLAWGVPKPVLWWPNGYGEPALYRLDVALVRGGDVLDSHSESVGLRTIRVDRSPDAEEVGADYFTFVVNDAPIFIKGSNWVPMDVFNGRASPERYAVWLDLLREAHGNLLRIWGGGQYEPTSFYETADRMGILIWHDFMFSCARYPDYDPLFVEEVRREAEYQVKRLRNRPCMAIWVGSNENSWLDDLDNWQTPGLDFPGKKLETKILPEIVHRFAPDTFYWPSSPYGGDDYNSDQTGDRHNWYTWHANPFPRRFGQPPKKIEAFASPTDAVNYWHLGEDRGRFVSEFGIHGSPVLDTLRRNIPPEGLYPGSPALLFRVRNAVKGRGELMMEAHTGLPRDIEEYVDFMMMVQAEGLKHGIEHYRRRKFHCSGAMFWQWNDDWPSITWSVLDYYTLPKAAYFFVKRAFAPVMVSVNKDGDPRFPGGRLSVWGVNDTLEPVYDRLTWTHLTFAGRIRRQETVPVAIPANAACELLQLDRELRSAAPTQGEMIWLHSESGLFPDNRYFFDELKDLRRERPEVHVDWRLDGDGLIATLYAEQHAYFVSLFVPDAGVRYSDNWIDLFPTRPATIRLWHKDGRRLSPDDVQVRWR